MRKKDKIQAHIVLNHHRCSPKGQLKSKYIYTWKGKKTITSTCIFSVKGSSVEEIISNLDLREVQQITLCPISEHHLMLDGTSVFKTNDSLR